MKVLILTTTFPRWMNDTTPAFIYELSKRLRENGLEIVVLAPHCEGAKKVETMDGMKVYRFSYFYPAKYQRLAYGGGILPGLKRSNLAKIQIPLFFLSELLYAFKIVKKEGIDAIHSHWIIPSGLVGAVCRRVFVKKHILTEHAAGVAALEKLPLLKRQLANFILSNSDRITVVSSYVQKRLLNLPQPKLLGDIKNNVEIISMGVNTTTFKPNKDKNDLRKKYNIKSKNVLLFIGRLAEKKGLEYLINAMPEIISKNSDTELIVCGDGPLREEYEELVEKKDFKKNIRFTGYITNKEKIEYLFLSDILVIPSIVTETRDTEGLPVVILEGLAAGKPIIASNVGGIRDVIEDRKNGLLVAQKNPKQIAEKVLELLNDETLKARFSNNALKTSKKYDWAIIGKKYEKIIRSVVR